jgi:hypothetical protein
MPKSDAVLWGFIVVSAPAIGFLLLRAALIADDQRRASDRSFAGTAQCR